MTDAVTVIPAEGAPRPLVFDSPHTGMLYPDDFRPALDMAVCERVNDWFVEDLFGAAPAHAASKLPRRRSLGDFVYRLLSGGQR